MLQLKFAKCFFYQEKLEKSRSGITMPNKPTWGKLQLTLPHSKIFCHIVAFFS